MVKILMMEMIAHGALNSGSYIWAISDIGVGLITWLNIIGILIIFFMARPTMKVL